MGGARLPVFVPLLCAMINDANRFMERSRSPASRHTQQAMLREREAHLNMREEYLDQREATMEKEERELRKARTHHLELARHWDEFMEVREKAFRAREMTLRDREQRCLLIDGEPAVAASVWGSGVPVLIATTPEEDSEHSAQRPCW